MIEFLSSNWQFFVAVGLGLIELILMLVFKRKPEINFKGLLQSICEWVATAEIKYKVGSDKMNYVLECAKVYLGDHYDEKSVRNIVEYILTLPQKKEGK